ncbi:MAG: VanZ family protein [Rubrivivax sp.]|nr:VanZ family protein [Rubrivivax sp.]
MAAVRHRSSATPLALAYAALVLYASLYPFTGWRWPPGQTLPTMAVLAWPPWRHDFDLWSNLLGYLPLGALLLIAARRSGVRVLGTLALAVAAPALLSYAMEVLQHFVPGRHPSLKDLALNSAGALCGALLAGLWHAVGLVDRWHALRERWFARDSAGALALLALWPVALLFPAPVSFGLGQVDERLRETLADWLHDVPWADAAYQLLAAPAPPVEALRPLTEALIVACGLLAPCLLAYGIVAPGWRRVAMAAGACALGVGGMTLSTLLNFGPAHALAWLSPVTLPGLGLGALLAVLLAPLPPRLVPGVGLVVLTGLVVGVAQAPDDPYFAQSLQAWEQGQFVRFHGLAQWIGWLWPYAAMGWMLSRLGLRR